MKVLITSIMLILFAVVSQAQQIDTRTKNQVKAKYTLAQDYFAQGNYKGTLEKIEESEDLLKGAKLPSLLDLKVKTLIALGRYSEANDALYVLEGLELSDEIVNNIGGYSVKIEKGIEAEFKEKKQKAIDDIFYRSMYYKYSVFKNNPPKTLLIEVKKNEKKSLDGWPFESSVRVNDTRTGVFVNEKGLVASEVYKNPKIREFRNPTYYRYSKPFNYARVFYYDGSSRTSYEWFIDHEGKELFKNRFHSVENYDSGFMRVSIDGRGQIINSQGEIVLQSGTWNSSADDRKLDVYGLSEGMVKIGYLSISKYPLMGYYNVATGEKIERKFKDAGNFSEGLAWVTYEGQDYVINKKGEFVLGPFEHYEDKEPFKHGLSIVERNDNEFAVYNNKGDLVLPFEQYNTSFAIKITDSGNIITDKGVQNKYRKWGLFSSEGKLILEHKYTSISEFGENRFKVYENKEGSTSESASLLDANCRVITNLEYEFIGGESQGRIPAKFRGSIGFIDRNGSKKIEYQYEKVHYFREGLASVMKNGKWGVIDLNGNEVIPFIYDDIWYFFDGITVAELNGEQIIIDKKGDIVM